MRSSHHRIALALVAVALALLPPQTSALPSPASLLRRAADAVLPSPALPPGVAELVTAVSEDDLAHQVIECGEEGKWDRLPA